MKSTSSTFDLGFTGSTIEKMCNTKSILAAIRMSFGDYPVTIEIDYTIVMR